MIINDIKTGDIVLVKQMSPYSDSEIIEVPYKVVEGVTIKHPRMELTLDQAKTLYTGGEITGIFKSFWDKNDIELEHTEDYIKINLTPLGWDIYKKVNGFYESNIDSDGYSTFSLKYFNRVFYGFMGEQITDHEIIPFKK